MIRRSVLLACVSLLATSASAENMRSALIKAYEKNPTLAAARASQRANDENVPIARADGLPSASLTGSYNEFVVIGSNSFTAPKRAAGYGVQVEVPIYQGGFVKNSVRAAKTRVDAGVDTLRGTESSIFNQVVAAYMDVIRDSAIVGLNRENVKVLGVNLRATNDRFEVGDLTRTDIAQSQARLARALSDLRTAESQLISSRERYVQLVGDVPVDLEPPPPLPNLPANPDDAVDVAVANNPDLAAAAKQRDASDFDIRAARAARLPRLSAVGQGNYSNYLGSIASGVPGLAVAQDQKSASIGISASLPIYQGGRPSAQIRQAQARSSEAIERVTEVERSVVAQTRASYASWRSSLEVIQSAQSGVDANTLSLEGVRAENSVGNRTILDILDAEQELLNSQVQLVQARRNAYVAGFTLLASMGQAEARDLGLDGGTALYDPTANYRRVKGIIWDWQSDPKPQPVATRTVDTPSQNPETTPLPQK